MAVLPQFSISTIVPVDESQKSLHCPLIIRGKKTIGTSALLDTGAAGSFIDKKFVERHRLPLRKLIVPITVYNVDQTVNKEGKITQYTWLDLVIGGVVIPTRLHVTGLGTESLILGLPWMKRVNIRLGLRDNKIEINPDQILPEPSLLQQLRKQRDERTTLKIEPPTDHDASPLEEIDDQELLLGFIHSKPVHSIFDPVTEPILLGKPTIGRITCWQNTK